MLAAEYYSNSDIRITQIEKPKIQNNEILVRMAACGICGTDVMEWYRTKDAPKVLGHEMSGTIVEVGSEVTGFKKDERVFVSHHVPCFKCRNIFQAENPEEMIKAVRSVVVDGKPSKEAYEEHLGS